MTKNKIYYFFLVIVLGTIAYIIWDSLSQPGVGNLKGGFTEVGFYRNENNTGPIVRIYAVSVSDTLWEEMEQYGTYMPHSKYGNTKVYFFDADKSFPTELFPGEQNFDKNLNQFCLALYEKNAMGQEVFIKRPYSRFSQSR